MNREDSGAETRFLKLSMSHEEPSGERSDARFIPGLPPPTRGTVSIGQARPGARIVNSNGVPGTLGCLARTLHDGQPVLLSTWHVLFGNKAPEASAVWLQDDSASKPGFLRIGRLLYGKLGVVYFEGQECHIDCAIAALQPSQTRHNSAERTALTWATTGSESLTVGSMVTKLGATSGITTGLIADIDFSAMVSVKGRKYFAQRQLLIRPREGHCAFSAEGDSGSIVVDCSNRAVGLLWGTNVRGEGVASPIAPVLYAMNIALA